MLKMLRTTIIASPLKVGYGIGSRQRVKARGMPPVPCLLLHKCTLFLFFNNYLAPLHSRPSYRTKSAKTHLIQRVKVTNLEDALHVFDEMRQMRPLPSVFHFTQILTQVAKLKHYSAVISFNNNETSRAMGLIQQMVENGFSADASTAELVLELLSKDKVDPALLPLIE